MHPNFKRRAARLGLLLLGHALAILAASVLFIYVGWELPHSIVLFIQCGLLNLWALTSRRPFLAAPFALAGGSLVAAGISMSLGKISYSWYEWGWDHFVDATRWYAAPGVFVILSLLIYRLLLRRSAWFRRGAKEAARMRFGLRLPLYATGFIALVLAVPTWIPILETLRYIRPVIAVTLAVPVLAAYFAFVTDSYQKRCLVIAALVSAGVGALPWYYFGEMLFGIAAYIWLAPAISVLTFFGLKTAQWLCGKSFRLFAFPPSR